MNTNHLPAVNIFPAPVNTTARQSESSEILLKHSTISLQIKTKLLEGKLL
jgi:hypothetical protein